MSRPDSFDERLADLRGLYDQKHPPFAPPAREAGETETAYMNRLDALWVGRHDEERRRPGETSKPYAERVTELLDRRVAEEMAAVAPVSPTCGQVALLWAARKAVPLFLSTASAAAFALGWPEAALVLLGAASHAWGAST